MIVISEPSITVVGTGSQGPAGVPGPAGGETFPYMAGEAVSAFNVLRAMDATNAGPADNRVPAHKDAVIGLSLTSAFSGNPITVRRFGKIVNTFWSWTPAQPIFCGVSGVLTQAPPEILALMLDYRTTVNPLPVPPDPVPVDPPPA